jgi:hypothetical protein
MYVCGECMHCIHKPNIFVDINYMEVMGLVVNYKLYMNC